MNVLLLSETFVGAVERSDARALPRATLLRGSRAGMGGVAEKGSDLGGEAGSSREWWLW